MMPNGQNLASDPDRPKFFQIRLQGHLGQQWANWFDGLTITLEEDGSTLMTGLVTDQAALHGILKKIRDLGMPLLSINSVETDSSAQTNSDDAEGDIK